MRGAQVTCETYDVQQASPGIATISFEQQKIQIPLDFEDAKNKLIYEAVRSLQRRVDHLEKELLVFVNSEQLHKLTYS